MVQFYGVVNLYCSPLPQSLFNFSLPLLLPGAEGKVDESLAMMAEIEEIKGKKKALEDEYHAAIPRHAAQQQKLRACEVCGAFLSMYDNDRRLADHFGGKLHIGFVTIREKIKQLEVGLHTNIDIIYTCQASAGITYMYYVIVPLYNIGHNHG